MLITSRPLRVPSWFLVRSWLKDCWFCWCNSVSWQGGAHSSCWLYNVLCPGSWWPHYSPALGCGSSKEKGQAVGWGLSKSGLSFSTTASPRFRLDRPWPGPSWDSLPVLHCNRKGLGSWHFLSAGFAPSTVSRVPCLCYLIESPRMLFEVEISSPILQRGRPGLKKPKQLVIHHTSKKTMDKTKKKIY